MKADGAQAVGGSFLRDEVWAAVFTRGSKLSRSATMV